MKGVIYARYSSDNQREESIEGQIRENTAFADKNGIEIVGTYIDRALSAKTDNRPEFQRMVKDSAKKNFDVVIVWKLDRFSRDRYDSAIYKAILRKNGVKVLSATEVISSGAEGILVESFLEGLAEYYSVDLAEKVLRGHTENAIKCQFNGSTVPYGYVIDEAKHYQINPVTAPIVREIFEQYANGVSITEIITMLNARGLKTSRGGAFNKNSLHRMFKNRNYIGEYHYRDIATPGGVPAIVPLDVFERVAVRIEKNKHASAKNKAPEKYILTTKLFCGKCKTMMVGDSAQKKNGTVYRYYKCAGAKRHECDKKSVRKEDIEQFVLARAVQILNDTDLLDKIADQVLVLLSEENTLIPALEAQLKEVRKAIDNIMKAIEMGVFTRSTKERLEELEAEEERLEAGIREEDYKMPHYTKEQILLTLAKFRDLDLTVTQNRERLIDNLIVSILLYDDGKLIITFTFKDEPLTFSLDELNAVEQSSDINALASPKKKHPSLLGCFLFSLFADVLNPSNPQDLIMRAELSFISDKYTYARTGSDSPTGHQKK